MSGFKEGSLQLRKKDVSTAADQSHLKILVDTNNNLYTVDEYGVYRAVGGGGFDIQVSGTSLNLVTSGATKILSLNDSGVVSGAYGSPTIIASFVVGKDGRIISAANVPISATGLGTVTSVGIASNSLVVSSSPITTFGDISVNLSAIGTSGIFTKVVKDVYGRIVSGGYISASDLPMLSAYTLQTTTSGISANFNTKINSISANYTPRTEVSGISANLQTQITNNNNSLSAYYRTSGGNISGNISASGNITGNFFIKIGGTSAQFLKANGSIDSNVYITSSSLIPYTLTTTTSAISGSLQNQINSNNLKLSGYLPLSGGNVYGRLYLGNASNNGYLDLKTNGTSAGQTDINYRGGISANRRMTIRYDEIRDAIEIFSSNDDGSSRTSIQRMYRDQNTPSRYYTGLDVFSGNLSIQSLSASKLVGTDASKNLISYTLTSADIANHAQKHYYNGTDPINGQALSGLMTSSTPTFSTLKLIKSLGATISAATRIELLNNDSTYGHSFWSDSGSNLRLAFLYGDSTWTDKFKFSNNGDLSAVGNITAPQFNGNLNGYKNVEFGNETTIANGFVNSAGTLYINYRGATSAISEYRFWNGLTGPGAYSNIRASAFIKNGGTSAQFLKGDGSVDSSIYITSSSLIPYTLTTTTSAISGNLQLQINTNNNKLSAYLPLSGGNVYGVTTFGNASNNGYVYVRTNGQVGGAADIAWLGSVSANRRFVLRFNENDYMEWFTANDDGSPRADKMRMYRNSSSATKFYTGLDVATGAFSVQSLSASKLVSTNAAKELISYTLTSADIPNISNVYLPLSGGSLTGNLSARQTIKIIKALGATISAASRIELLNNDSTYGHSFWSDSNSNLRLAFLYGDSTWTDKFKFSNNGDLSAVGNITAPQFNGNLNGYKNVDNLNECTISNGYVNNSGNLFINYRGATSAITQYRFCNGLGAIYSGILASAFIKNGGTSAQFLKADGSVDSNAYSQTSSLSAYLPLSGGTVYGPLYLGNSANNANLYLRTNGTSAGIADFNFLGSTSASRRFVIRYREDNDYIEWFSNNDDGSPRLTKIRMYRNSLSATKFFTGIDLDSGNLKIVALSASKLVATDSSKNLISYNLTSADIPTISNLYLPLSGGTLTGQLNAKYISGDSGALIGLNAQEVLRIYRPTSGVTSTFGQTFEANNNVGQRVIYARIRTNIDGAVSGLHSGSFIFSVYKNGAEVIPMTVSDTQLKMFGTISAFSNITAPQFNGNLNGYKNVDLGNETTIANGFASNQALFVNYRGATSSINQYNFWNGLAGAGAYAGILASAFKKNGGTSAQFLKADGSVDTNSFGNYLPLSGGTLTGNLIVKEAFVGTSSLTDNAYFCHKLQTAYPSIRQSFQGYTTIDSKDDLGNDLGLDLCINNDPKIAVRSNKITVYETLTTETIEATNLYFSGVLSNNSFTGNKAVVTDSSKNIVEANATATEVSYLVGVSANVQTQINQLLQASVSGTGSGTVGYVSKFVTGTSVGNSTIQDSGSLVTINNPLSATGNISAPNFVGSLDGSKNVEFGNETTIAKNYASTGGLWINYRGATSAISEYRMGSGRSDSAYANVKANGFIKNGGTSTQFLMADGSVTNGSILAGYYLPLSGGTLTGNLYLNINGAQSLFIGDDASLGDKNSANTIRIQGTQNSDQAYFHYGDGPAYFGFDSSTFVSYGSINPTITNNFDLGSSSYRWRNIHLTELVLKNSAIITSGSNQNSIRIKGTNIPENAFIEFGTGSAYFGFINTTKEFVLSGSFVPDTNNVFDLGSSSYRWRNIYASNLYENGIALDSKYLPLSGGTLTGNLYLNINGAQSLFIGDDASLGDKNSANTIRIQGTQNSDQAYFHYGDGPAYFGFDSSTFVSYGSINPTITNNFDLGSSSYSWKRIYAKNFYENGISLDSKYLHLSGGTLTGNLRISAVSESWSEGLRIMVPENYWGGLRLTRNDSLVDTEDNWAVGYANNDSGNLEVDVYTGVTQLKHTIFYKNGNTFHVGDVQGFKFTKTGGTSQQYLMADGSVSYSDSISDKYLPLSGGTLTGNLFFSNPDLNTFRGIRGQVGTDDFWGIRGGAGTIDEGFVEIFTEDNGHEPIYVKQYNAGVPSTILTLLDASNNTYIPNDISVNKLSIRANNQQGLFIGDNASLGDCDTDDSIRIQGQQHSDMAYFVYGNNNARFGFDNVRFTINRNLRPIDRGFDLGGIALGNNWAHVYSEEFVRYGGTNQQFLMADGSVSYGDHLSNKFLPLSGGTMSGGIYGSGFHSGTIAMFTSSGVGSLSHLIVENPSSILPQNINFENAAYVGGWNSPATTPSNSVFYSSDTNKSNAIVVSDGNVGLRGGIYFANLGNSYIGQKSDNILRVRGNTGITFDGTGDYSITFQEKTIFDYLATFNNNITLNGNITNHITYTTATNSGGVFPEGYTYYKTEDSGEIELPNPIETKVIYLHNYRSSIGDTELRPKSGHIIVYRNFSGVFKYCDSTKVLPFSSQSTLCLIGCSSTKFAIIGPWFDPV